MRINCYDCPRRCGGVLCGVEGLKIARADLHFWEEPVISGTRGSGTIFFSGCNLKCIYCQNYNISHYAEGKEVTPKELSEIIKKLEGDGAHNINFVTPSHYISEIKRTLDLYKPSIPIVYNTSSYDSAEGLVGLKDYIDIYLADYKYSDDNLAKSLSNVDDYVSVATTAIKTMKVLQPKDVVEDGIMKKGVVLRHLILPNNIKNSLNAIEFITSNFDSQSYVSVMSQYIPCGKANKHEKINRKIKPLEYNIIINKLEKAGFSNVFIQELSSATENFIPEFNKE